MEGLAFGGKPTGVIYGFIKDCQELCNRFNTKRMLFCFDYGYGKRYKLYDGYKQKRQDEKANEDEEKQLLREALHDQIDGLRDKWLALIGFSNVFYQKGYEGDDVIADIAARVPENHKAVIVTADKDMYQCLRPNVDFYNPNKRDQIVTEESFEDEWGIEAPQWAMVKAIAGCSSDEVKGIKGVGELTAAKFLRGEISSGKKFLDVTQDLDNKNGIIATNLPIVKLPLEGTKRCKIKKDAYNQKGFTVMCKELGFKSLLPTQGTLIKGKTKTFWDI